MSHQLSDRLLSVESSKSLSNFVEHLREDLVDNRAGWENDNLERYLAALSQWIDDIDGFAKNANVDLENMSPWQLFAMMLLAAKIYE